MSRFQLLCVTMNQNDFSKIQQMNIHSDVIFANQADYTAFDSIQFEDYTAKMITTTTKGVGINRNFSLSYADAEICLFADDDVVYNDNYRDVVLNEFDAHPDADIIIFHFDTDSNRKQIRYHRTKKCGRFWRQPWGGIRIAFRLNSIRKANLNFTTLFGGGCVFPSGEDSMWLSDARKKGLTFYVSKETIGKVNFDKSSWFTGVDERFFYGKGAFYEAVHPKTFFVWSLYFAFRTRNMTNMKLIEKIKWLKLGRIGYLQLKGFDEMIKSI